MAAAEQRENPRQPDPMREIPDEVRSALRDADERVRGFVSEQPLVAIGLAVAAGYLAGRLLRRL